MRWFNLLFFLVLFPIVCFSELSKFYPTSAVITTRDNAYTDAMSMVYKSTQTFELERWESLGSTYTWISSNTSVSGFYTVFEGTTGVVVTATWTLSEYTKLVYDEARLRALNDVMDDSIESYLVFPSTGPCPEGWRGWRQSLVNGRLVPGSCQ